MKYLAFIIAICLIVIITTNGIAFEKDVLLIYSFNDISGKTIKDISGNKNDGVLNGDASWTKDGKFGGGVVLDGNEDYIDCGKNEKLQLVETDFTLTAWVYPTSISQQSFGGGIGGTIFQTVQKPNDSEGFALGIKDSGLLWWWNTHNIDKYSVSKVPLNEWTHVTVVFKFKGGGNNTLEFYLNGKLDNTATGVPDMKVSPTNLCIGHRSWITGWFKGIMDETRVYSRVLNQDEIVRIMETDGLAVDPKTKLSTTWSLLRLKHS